VSRGSVIRAGGGEAAVDQVRPVPVLLELAFGDAHTVVEVGGGEVGQGAFEQ
jgi:hypothetical protein